jgi:uncharacterized protein YbjT (DUF2867 family)
VVVNCVGILQDGAGGSTEEVHGRFVERLVAALRLLDPPALLIHIGIPGRAGDDRTAFSRTKRRAERMIGEAEVAAVILRPGLVVAPAAYGSSALIRSFAALPVDLPADLLDRPCAAVAAEDISSLQARTSRV